MEGTVSGHHRSPHRGSSVEFAEYRNYTPGDDIRRLDWRVFARTDRYYLKEFEAFEFLEEVSTLDHIQKILALVLQRHAEQE